MMTGKDDDAASIREDSFLAELVPQVAEHLAEQHAADYDAEDGRGRFLTWLAAHTEEPVAPAKGYIRPAGIGWMGRILMRLSSARQRIRHATAPGEPGSVPARRRRADRGQAQHAYRRGTYGADSFSAEDSKQHRQLLNGQNCTVFLTDVVGFSSLSRTDEDRLIIREALFSMTHAAVRDIRDTWSEDRGDGLLTVVSPNVPTAKIMDQLLLELPAALEQHNGTQRDSARFKLRLAVNVGPVARDNMGVHGEAIISTARLVEAPSLKEAIAKSTANLGVIAAPFVYDTVIRHGPSASDRASYSQVPVEIKGLRTTAWMKLFDTEQTPRQFRGGKVPSGVVRAGTQNLRTRNDQLAALVARAAEGDQNAWMKLVEWYAPLVYTVCTRYPLGNHDIDDVAQNVWLLLIEQLGKLREPAALPGWLATATARECLRVVRASRKPEQLGSSLDNSLQFLDDRVIDEKMGKEQFQAALQGLMRKSQTAPSWFVETSKKAYA
jgi:class 3 adenylate cyclase